MTTWTHTSSDSDPTNPKMKYGIDNSGPVSAVTISEGGSGYAVNDELTLDSNGDGDCVFKVTAGTTTNGKTITAVDLVTAGDLYYVGTSCSTTVDSGVGSGCILTISSISLSSTDWSTLYVGVWNLGSFVDWEDLDRKNWEDWN